MLSSSKLSRRQAATTGSSGGVGTISSPSRGTLGGGGGSYRRQAMYGSGGSPSISSPFRQQQQQQQQPVLTTTTTNTRGGGGGTTSGYSGQSGRLGWIKAGKSSGLTSSSSRPSYWQRAQQYEQESVTSTSSSSSSSSSEEEEGLQETYVGKKLKGMPKKFGKKKSHKRSSSKSKSESCEEILRDLCIDRERDYFHAKLICNLAHSNERNVHMLLHALENGEKVPREDIYDMLLEDVLLDAATDDVILEIVEDWKQNRKVDEIIHNLSKGRLHTKKRTDEQEEQQDEDKDMRLHKIVKKLIKPDAGAHLVKMCDGDWKSVCAARGCNVPGGASSIGLGGGGAGSGTIGSQQTVMGGVGTTSSLGGKPAGVAA